MNEPLLLDTCAWIWIAQGHERIHKKATTYLEKHSWALSAISIWEISMLCSKGRIKINTDIRTWVNQALTRQPNISLIPLSPEILMLSTELNIAHQDPADRMILATAKDQKLTLVTGDQIMLSQASTQLKIKIYAL